MHKFAAGHRYLSYRWPSCSEQGQAAAHLRAPDGENRLLSRVMCDCADGATMVPRIPYFDFERFAPGEFSRRHAETKGLRTQPSELLAGRRTFEMDDSPAALDWFPRENGDVFRWSGPNPNPCYFLPIQCAQVVRLQIHIVKFSHESLADLLTLELNDQSAPLQMRREARGEFIFATVNAGPVADGLKLQFHLPRNEWRREVRPARYCGFALRALEVEPLPEVGDDASGGL